MRSLYKKSLQSFWLKKIVLTKLQSGQELTGWCFSSHLSFIREDLTRNGISASKMAD